MMLVIYAVKCGIPYEEVKKQAYELVSELNSRKPDQPFTVDDVNREAKKVLLEKEIEILVDLKSGDEGATAWGCDLTYDYVKINGDYRT